MNELDKNDEVTQLRHTRGVLKSKLTRFEKFLKATENQSKLEQIESRVKSIEEDSYKFDTIQSRLEFLDNAEENERENVEGSYFETISLARKYLKKQQTAPHTNASNILGQLQQQPIAAALGRLPDLGLPSFHGSYESWLGFSDIYNSVIHNRSDLSDTQKFLYLKICCKGDALKLIDNLEITANNYGIALDLLRKRYENRRAIINHHINSLLFNLPDVTRESAQALRHLIDAITQHTSALEKLNLPVEHWDALLIPIILTKLDDRSKREWESKLDNNKMPTLYDLTESLTKKCFTLEAIYSNSQVKPHYTNRSNISNSKSNSLTYNKFQNFSGQSKPLQQCYASAEKMSCEICVGRHYIYQCSKFLALSISEKYNEVRKHKLCTNCLRSGHYKMQCQSSNCKKCNLKHSTLLHDDTYKNIFINRDVATKSGNSARTPNVKATHLATDFSAQGSLPTLVTKGQIPLERIYERESFNDGHVLPGSNIVGNVYEAFNANTYNNQVLLSTAKILIADFSGKLHECTALLDSGSQSNLISQALCDKLKLNCEHFSTPLAGINQIITNINFKTSTIIKSRYNGFQAKLNFLVLPVITEKLPLIGFPKDLINYPKNIQLADEKYNEPKVIDLLLGANIFYELLGTGKIKLGQNMPGLQETLFGWILTGTIVLDAGKRQISRKKVCNFIQTNENDLVNETLRKFWEIEEIPQKQILSNEAKYCEDYFIKTTVRNPDGRFVVRLPFIENSTKELGNSKDICCKRFVNIESRLQRNKDLKIQYKQFMEEYETLGHMTLQGTLDLDNSQENKSYFLPHHPVIREASLTTQCRVVFDASFKTSTDASLNDLLCLGPTVQDDLFSIILRFRLKSIVLNADVKMMYRQILIDPSDRPFQKILWRHDTKEPIQVYLLNTVTYGTKSAPYLATRCLKQLAIENQESYPRTSRIIENSFYMDDLILSVDSVEEALQIYTEITNILSQAGLELRKWSSNKASILEYIVRNSTLKDDKLIIPYDNKELKTLGISWNPNLDTLKYSINVNSNFSQVTKRSILSIISQIYDPLGLIGPALIKVKILMQQLWKLQLEWDQAVPEEVKIFWLKFLSQIPVLTEIQIKRQVLQNSYESIELHGFCDASIKAYGAAIYLCSINNQGERSARLLCAKSKVAPLKILTLPRLELLAAVLLAKLTRTIKDTLDIKLERVTLYSDSTIVLSWLKLDPSLLKTFVGNRVAKITELTDVKWWNHVRSENNAADIISRGIEPEELYNAKLWWYGPSFLVKNYALTEINNTLEVLEPTELPEIKKQTVTLVVSKESNFEIFEKYSTLSRLQRIIGYILRFKNRTLKKIQITSEGLTVDELSEALNVLIRLAQSTAFLQEIKCLKKRKVLDRKSKLLSLNPFLDQQGILRVGGRLSQSPDIEFNQKHPIILPYRHKLTYLIVRSEHIKYMHVGIQNLLSILRLTYWPINGKNMVKQVIRSCVRCFRVKPQASKFLMGQLPAPRVTPNRIFAQCAVDYAGPILVKDGIRRKCQLVKTYICVFVCLAVRAVHIELVNDLSTDSFLNALKRFTSRRGKPNDIYSDNGLNFVGASNHFLELHKLLSDKKHNKDTSEFLAKEKINWHFIPARSPHVGGLWEAAIKATKYHLRRVLGNASLHYEEMYTLLIQIEACLNSRPLTPLSNDRDDFLPLTPAHFLIGNSLACAPQADVQEIKTNKLTRYQYLQQLLQQFWSRWSQEYLSQLQVRTKWKTEMKTPVKLGSLVIMVEDNMRPLRWPMARITELHPGADNIVRVVSVRTASGKIFKRSMAKICVLPIEMDSKDN